MTNASAGPGASLSAKQKRFVEEYLVDLNATQAAIRAGYSEKSAEVTGHRLLSNAKVAAAIAAGQTARSERTGVTMDYVLSSIVDTMERCKQASPVLDRKGDPVMVETATGETAPAYAFNPTGVLKGAELLMKHLSDNAVGGANEVADALREIAGKLPG